MNFLSRVVLLPAGLILMLGSLVLAETKEGGGNGAYSAQSASSITEIRNSESAIPNPQSAIQNQNYAPGQVLVKFKAGTSTGLQKAAHRRMGASPAKSFSVIPVHQVAIPDSMSVEEAVEKYRQDPEVEYAEPNYYRSYFKTIPDDRRFDRLWGMDNPADADIDAVEAWDIETGKSEIIVALIDSGVDLSHEDLTENIWANPKEIPDNGIDDDHNGYIDDVNGWNFAARNNDPTNSADYPYNSHGTAMAGAIGARGNNRIGITGVIWRAQIMPLAMNTWGLTVADEVEAIDYAVQHGAKVINASFGSEFFSRTEKEAISRANEAGVLMVAAAGNNGWDNDLVPVYPAGYDLPNIIAVAATGRHDYLTSFSNYGDSSVHLAAPGEHIYTTIPENGYQYIAGTSPAAAYVSGAAALIWAHEPDLSHLEVKARLMESVDHLPQLADKTVSGGRINLARALGAVFPDPPADLLVTSSDQGITLTWADPTTNEDGSPLSDLSTIQVYDNDSLTAAITAGVKTYLDPAPAPRPHVYHLRAVNSRGYESRLSARSERITTAPSISFDFEDDGGGFKPNDNWAWRWGQVKGGPRSAHSGENAWGVNLVLEYYSGGSSGYLDSPLLTLPPDAYLSFYHYVETITGQAAGCNVKISTDGGKEFSLLEPEGGYPTDEISALDYDPGFSGQSGDYLPVVFDLSEYARKKVIIRFEYGIGFEFPCWWWWGEKPQWEEQSFRWYIDDVAITARSLPPIVTSIQPSFGGPAGKVAATISGSGFQAGALVVLRGEDGTKIEGTNLTVVDSGAITANFDLSGAEEGAHEVVVTNPDGLSASLPAGFTINPTLTVTVIYPSSGLNSGSLSLTAIFGSQFMDGSGLKLTFPGEADIEAAEIEVISSNQIKGNFDLTGARTGLWDVVVTNPDGQSAALKTGFLVNTRVSTPYDWEMTDIGQGEKSGAMVAVVVGDADNDGLSEVYGANSDGYLYVNKDGEWLEVVLLEKWKNREPMKGIAIGDADNDGEVELYGVGRQQLYRFEWNGRRWKRTAIGPVSSYSGDIVIGDGNNDGRFEIYLTGSKNIYSLRWTGADWKRSTVGSAADYMGAVAIGDGDNDGLIEVYGAANDGHIYQFRWAGSDWKKTDLGEGPGPMLDAAVGDGNNDGFFEVYGACQDGHLYQFGPAAGDPEDIANVGSPLRSVTIGDGDNDGKMEIYVAAEDGHLFRIEDNGTITALGKGSDYMLSAATGDGDNDGYIEVYAGSSDSHLYQFAAVSAPRISGINPDFGSGTPEVTLSGVRFGDGAEVKLVLGETEITGTDITVTDSAALTASFDLTEAQSGRWDVVVTNPDGQSNTLTKGFFVDPATALTMFYPPSGANTGMVDVFFFGKYLSDDLEIKLTRAGQPDIEAAELKLTSAGQLEAGFDLTDAAPGPYQVMVTTLEGNSVGLPELFLVNAPQTQAYGWQTNNIGRVSPELLTMLTAGDGNNDGEIELYSSGLDGIQQFKWTTSGWDKDYVGSWRVFFVGIGDADNDGEAELYGTGFNGLYQFKWTGRNWEGVSLGLEADIFIIGFLIGDADNDGMKEIYAADNSGCIYQIRRSGPAWERLKIGSIGGMPIGGAIADGDNDGSLELYVSNAEGEYIYQFRWTGSKWERNEVGSNEGMMGGLAVGDPDNDGQTEVYAVNEDGSIYQFRWNDPEWEKSKVIKIGKGIQPFIVIGDGNNDGNMELYASDEKGAYQIQWTGAAWQKSLMCSLSPKLEEEADQYLPPIVFLEHKKETKSETLKSKLQAYLGYENEMPGWILALTDGDNDGSLEIYGTLPDIGGIYQIKQTTGPELSAVTPSHGTDTGPVTITISGARLHEGAAVYLANDEEDMLSGSGVNIADSTTLTVTFDLTGASLGDWDVVFTNPDGQSDTLEDGFRVIAPKPTLISIDPDRILASSLPVEVEIAGADFRDSAEVKLDAVSFFEDGESGDSKWELFGFSLTTEEAHSGNYSFSAGGNNESPFRMETSDPVLVMPGKSTLSFWVYSAQDWVYPAQDYYHSYYYLELEISLDARKWESIGSQYGEPGFWVERYYDLSKYEGKEAYLRFTCGGWGSGRLYLDDIVLGPVIDLADVSFQGENLITATIPAGTMPDTYNVTVINPGGRKATLSNALWIERGPIRVVYVDINNTSGKEDGSQDFPYTGIQAAIDVAFSGDTVSVAPGTYKENLVIEGKDIAIIGSSSKETSIEGAGGDIGLPVGFDEGYLSPKYIFPNENKAAVTFKKVKAGRIEGFTIIGVAGWEEVPPYTSVGSEEGIIMPPRPIPWSGAAAIRCESANLVITGNVIAKGATGILLGEGSSAVISHNIIIDNTGSGIRVKPGPTSIVNNTIAGNGTGILMTFPGMEIPTSLPVAVNNIIAGNDIGITNHGFSPLQLRYNDVWGNSENYLDCSPGNKDISVDPLFVDPEEGDYHLRVNSPCIDAGDPDYDYSLEPEPNGGRINLGAYGNTPEATPTYPPDYFGSIAGTISYEGEAIAPVIYVQAMDEDGKVAAEVKITIYEYVLDNLLPGTYYLRAFIDLDGNEEPGSGEPVGKYPEPVEVVGGETVEGIDITLIQLIPRTIYVDLSNQSSKEDGSREYPYTGIQAGINAANSGDTVSAAAGKYKANLVIEGKEIKLIGASAGTTIIKGDNNTTGVAFVKAYGSRIENFTITAATGIVCEQSSPLIRNNIIDGGGFGRFGILADVLSHPMIENNTIVNTNPTGAGINWGWMPKLKAEEIIEMLEEGFDLLTLKPPIITNNIIVNNSGAGIKVDEESMELVLQQYSQDTEFIMAITNAGFLDVLMKWQAGWEGLPAPYIDYNNVWGNGVDYEGSAAGEGDISADPLFVGPDDYHLQPGSPSIDAGTPWADYSREPEPNGERVDMGAYGNTVEAASTRIMLTLSDRTNGRRDYALSAKIDLEISNDQGATAYLLSEGMTKPPAEDDPDWGGKPATLTLSEGEGTKTVYLWVKDQRGKVNAVPVSKTIILDSSKPTVSSPTEGSPDVDFDADGTFTVYWTPAEDEQSGIAGYELQEKQGGNGEWKSLSAKLSGDTISYPVTGRLEGNFYQYRLRAQNRAGLWSDYSITSDGIMVAANLVSKEKGREITATGTVLAVPAAALSSDGYLFIDLDPINRPRTVDPVYVTIANQADDADPSRNRIDGSLREISVYDSSGQSITRFDRPVTLSIVYSDSAPADGIVDGTSPKIAESGLKIFGLSGGQWVDVEKMGGEQLGVNAENNLVSAKISRASVYLLMAPVAATTLDQVVVYPNPFQLWKRECVTFGGKEPGRRLPAKATIRLYTVSGELIRTIEETDGDGEAAWDGRNEDREKVSSGVYIYVIAGDDGRNITGKLAVIR